MLDVCFASSCAGSSPRALAVPLRHRRELGLADLETKCVELELEVCLCAQAPEHCVYRERIQDAQGVGKPKAARACLLCGDDCLADELETRAARVFATDVNDETSLDRVGDHASDSREYTAAPAAQLRLDLAIRERHRKIDPTNTALEGGVDVRFRHATPSDRIRARKRRAYGANSHDFIRAHRRNSGFDLVDAGRFERLRYRDLFRDAERYTGSLFTVAQRAVVDHDTRKLGVHPEGSFRLGSLTNAASLEAPRVPPRKSRGFALADATLAGLCRESDKVVVGSA
jgi:hypothetical protein